MLHKYQLCLNRKSGELSQSNRSQSKNLLSKLQKLQKNQLKRNTKRREKSVLVRRVSLALKMISQLKIRLLNHLNHSSLSLKISRTCLTSMQALLQSSNNNLPTYLNKLLLSLKALTSWPNLFNSNLLLKGLTSFLNHLLSNNSKSLNLHSINNTP